MDDVEAIRKKLLQEMQKQMEEEQKRQIEKEIYENQKKIILRHILDSEARSRLERIRMAKPAEAEYIEAQLIRLYQMGRIRERINDEAFRVLIRNLLPKKREIKIRRV